MEHKNVLVEKIGDWMNGKRKPRILAAIAVLAIAVVGSYLLLASHAAVPNYGFGFEGESGSTAGNAAVGGDSVASAGAYLQLGGNVLGTTVSALLTTGDQTKLLSNEPAINLRSGTPTGSTVIHVSAAHTYQTIDGFGGAMTDSSAHVISLLPTATKNALMAKLFDPTSGIDSSFLRVPLGASDFATSSYTFDDMPAGQSDPNLTHFSIAHDEAQIIPLIKQAKALNPSLKLLASVWSPPGWMKSAGSVDGGTLLTADYQAYANYYVKAIQAYAADGVTFDALTPENEPGNATTAYPAMTLTAAQETTLIGTYLRPALAKAGLTTHILGLDHNWDMASYPETILGDSTAGPATNGTAWHCYSGTPDAQTTVHNAFPAKDTYFTECSGGDWSPDFTGNLNWDTTNLFIGGLRNWSQGVLLWNLALDTSDGPTNGGCLTCRGVVTINTASSSVSAYNIEYYVIAQASKAFRPGAIRIDSDSTASLESAAVKNTDGSYGLMVHNPTAAPTAFSVVAPNGQWFTYTIPANAVVSFRW